jgi:phosphoribosyl 1,2-cyclic phosphodiesterase
MSSPPKTNRNYRCNPSLLIDYEQEDGHHKYILIDVGKDFKEQVLRWFLHYKVPWLDAIILTHEHADAMLGLDDIREVLPCNPCNDIDPTPIFLNQFTMNSVEIRFPYLVQKNLKEEKELHQVAQLDWKIIENNCERPFNVADLKFTPLPVMHGEDYVSLGFLFGNKSRIAYVSDVSRFPKHTEDVISKSGGGQVDLLILDTLSKKRPRTTHFYLPESLEAVKRIQPKRALFVGMTHQFEHYRDNEELAEWSKREGIEVQLAYDGLKIPINL